MAQVLKKKIVVKFINNVASTLWPKNNILPAMLGNTYAKLLGKRFMTAKERQERQPSKRPYKKNTTTSFSTEITKNDEKHVVYNRRKKILVHFVIRQNVPSGLAGNYNYMMVQLCQKITLM